MPRAGLDAATVIARAAQMLDDPDSPGLSLAALAESLGVRPPSLYKHVDGMSGLQRGIMLQAKSSLTRSLEQATVGQSRDDAIRSMSKAYRRWALEHPGQYPLTVRAADAADAEDVAISTAAIDVILNVLAGYDLRGDDAIDATRFFRAALHGFVSLETGGAFQLRVDLERSFERLIRSVSAALSTWTTP